jgi:hypothetical protein
MRSCQFGKLAAEVNPIELLRLPGRESWCVERLNDLIRELPLLRRKHRRIAVPVQAGANVRVDSRALTRDLIRESMQVTDLLEQRLKFLIGNRHDRPRVRPPRDHSCPGVFTRGSARVSERLPPLRVCLAAEVGAVELPRLRGREPWIGERLHHLIGQVSLIARKRRWIVPAQSSSDVVMHRRLRASDLVGAPIQLPYLPEQCLEHVVIDRQAGSTPLAEEDTAGGRFFGRNLQRTGPPAAVRTHSHIRGEQSSRSKLLLTDELRRAAHHPLPEHGAQGRRGHDMAPLAASLRRPPPQRASSSASISSCLRYASR